MIELREYQRDGVERMRHALKNGMKAPILIAPTGAGKTVVASAIIESAVSRGKRALFLAHRIELISQAANKLAEFGIEHRVIAPNDAIRRMKIQQFKKHGKSFVSNAAPVSVGTVQTVSRRLKMLPPDLIIIDECHLSIAPTYQKCVEEFPRAIIIGLTATPKRLDGRGLGEMYDSMIKLAEPQDIADMGFLVPMRFFASRNLPDLYGIKRVRGDYDQRQLEDAVDKPVLIGDAVDHYRRIAHGRPAMAFCVSVKHAEDTAAQFRAAGYRAVATSGDTDNNERAAHIAGLADGTIDVVCNCALYIEGLDQPAIACIILLAPTQSLPRYLQSVGRGSRPAPGKTDCIVLDHAGNCLRHGHPYDSREWSLDGRVTNARDSADEPDVSVVTCPQCFIGHEPAPVCPGCGYIYPARVRKLIQQEGALVEIQQAGQVARKIIAQFEADGLIFDCKLAHTAREVYVRRKIDDMYTEGPFQFLGFVDFNRNISESQKTVIRGAMDDIALELATRWQKEQQTLDRKREQATADTLESLIEVGRQRGYKFPRQWAEKVWASRKNRTAMFTK